MYSYNLILLTIPYIHCPPLGRYHEPPISIDSHHFLLPCFATLSPHTETHTPGISSERATLVPWIPVDSWSSPIQSIHSNPNDPSTIPIFLLSPGTRQPVNPSTRQLCRRLLPRYPPGETAAVRLDGNNTVETGNAVSVATGAIAAHIGLSIDPRTKKTIATQGFWATSNYYQ
jgi:hypothetical protein